MMHLKGWKGSGLLEPRARPSSVRSATRNSANTSNTSRPGDGWNASTFTPSERPLPRAAGADAPEADPGSWNKSLRGSFLAVALTRSARLGPPRAREVHAKSPHRSASVRLGSPHQLLARTTLLAASPGSTDPAATPTWPTRSGLKVVPSLGPAKPLAPRQNSRRDGRRFTSSIGGRSSTVRRPPPARAPRKVPAPAERSRPALRVEYAKATQGSGGAGGLPSGAKEGAAFLLLVSGTRLTSRMGKSAWFVGSSTPKVDSSATRGIRPRDHPACFGPLASREASVRGSLSTRCVARSARATGRKSSPPRAPHTPTDTTTAPPLLCRVASEWSEWAREAAPTSRGEAVQLTTRRPELRRSSKPKPEAKHFLHSSSTDSGLPEDEGEASGSGRGARTRVQRRRRVVSTSR
mmetsp:Transcript_32705/g.73825  ORF Transcript_32705/g.73825 Transcript_32705/m.73825 type:complete len:408 (+) Transcript_32705:2328-3551(+)